MKHITGTFEHGTRPRYVSGCRCDECRAANTAAARARAAAAKAAVAELPARAPGQTTCSGLNGTPCPANRRLRKDSLGGICHECRSQLVWNGLVDAKPARKHLRKLSRRGIGTRSVRAACDVGRTTLTKILSGEKQRIKKSTLDRILEVDVAAIADHGLVGAGQTQKMLRVLEEEYFTKGAVAIELGCSTKALQIGRKRVLARTEQKVTRLYRKAKGITA